MESAENKKPWNGVSTWNVRPTHTWCTEPDKPMKRCLTGFLNGKLLGR